MRSIEDFYQTAREHIFSRDWPKGLIVDLRPEVNEFGLPQLYVVVYRDNWLTLRPEDHMKAAKIIEEAITKLRADGIPISFGKMESSNA